MCSVQVAPREGYITFLRNVVDPNRKGEDLVIVSNGFLESPLWPLPEDPEMLDFLVSGSPRTIRVRLTMFLSSVNGFLCQREHRPSF